MIYLEDWLWIRATTQPLTAQKGKANDRRCAPVEICQISELKRRAPWMACRGTVATCKKFDEYQRQA
jgi:hypothetical protein